MKKQSDKKCDSITENTHKHTPYLNWFRGIKLLWVSFVIGGLLLVGLAPILVSSTAAQCLLLLTYALMSGGFIMTLIRRGQKGASHGKKVAK
jgi:hypothetical protein